MNINDNLPKTLLKESMSALTGLHLAELTVKTYQKMRSDEEAELFFKTVSNKALDYTFINKAALPRKRKRPNMDLSIIPFKLKDTAILQTHIIPLLRSNTSGNNILKTSILSYYQLKIVSINLLSRHSSK